MEAAPFQGFILQKGAGLFNVADISEEAPRHGQAGHDYGHH